MKQPPRFGLIVDRRGIIDRRALADRLNELPGGELQAAVTALLQSALASGREEIARRDDRPAVPTELVYAGGERVRHPRFGEGIVVSSKMVPDDQEVTVAFKGDIGIKKLMLSFAPLEKL